MIKNKYILLIFFAAVFVFLNIGIARAALEVSYPQIPGLVTPSASCSGSNCLGTFAAYFFGILVYIAGFISLISFKIKSNLGLSISLIYGIIYPFLKYLSPTWTPNLHPEDSTLFCRSLDIPVNGSDRNRALFCNAHDSWKNYICRKSC